MGNVMCFPPSNKIFEHSMTNRTYDAYAKDIAAVNFYFETPVVFQYRRYFNVIVISRKRIAKKEKTKQKKNRQVRMTATDFLSQVQAIFIF